MHGQFAKEKTRRQMGATPAGGGRHSFPSSNHQEICGRQSSGQAIQIDDRKPD